MATKIKTITVTYPHHHKDFDQGMTDVYRIEVITDSVEFAPKSYLTKAQVDELCGLKDWKVTVKPSTIA